MSKIILIMATMASLAIGAELESFAESFNWKNLVGMLGASDQRGGYHAKKTEEETSKEQIPGYDTIPISMQLKDDVFYSGYFPVDNDNGQDMFYMLFESRSDRKKDPLVIWIRGEQGCSASADLFSEMGPYQFKVNETTGGIPTLVPNVHAWNNFTNLMILDAQIGTGYSFIRGAKPKKIWTMDNAVLYFVRFMKQFYAHHQEFRGREVYIVGQDFFGGKMIPLFVKALYDIDKWENRDADFLSPYLNLNVSPTQKWSEWINLKGIALGSPVIDEADIRGQLGDYAVENKLISRVEKFFFQKAQDLLCKPAVAQKSVLETAIICGVTESVATGNPVYPMFDLRNIREECKGWFTCQKYKGFHRFAMNQAEVLKLFRVNRNRTSVKGRYHWTECNPNDGWTLKDSFMKTEIGPNTTVHMGDILNLSKEKNLKVLIYVGDRDFQVNWMGLEKVISELDWYGKADFTEDSAGTYVPWSYRNAQTGQKFEGGGQIQYDYFTFLKIKNTGLMVHREKPELMSDMLKQWMANPFGQLNGSGNRHSFDV